MKFSEIKKLTQGANYQINVGWDYLQKCLDRWEKETRGCALDMNPKFQRGHVWTETQQIAYVEFKLRGGEGSNIIYFNCVGWMNSFEGPFVLVDGKQRINAVMRFLENEIPAFGCLHNDFEDKIGRMQVDFIFAVNNLEKEGDVLQWYLEMNSGGTPHTEEELEKVRKMVKSVKMVRAKK